MRVLSLLAFTLIFGIGASGWQVQAATPVEKSVAVTQTTAKTQDAATTAAMTALGKKIFFDQSLSASGRISCASCHDPKHAYAPPNNLSVQLGGPHMASLGSRAAPSLAYHLNQTPIWFKERASSFVERVTETDSPPFGGFGWDGRFNKLSQQAGFPLLNADEMANPSIEAVVEKLASASYAEDFRKAFGATIFTNKQQAYAQAMKAIEQFELHDPSFYPFTSKFDAYLDGKAKLSKQEERGLKLFVDPKGGNCTSCHTLESGADGSHPLFTNHQFEAIGVPRNNKIPANKDANYYDMGLCGPLRKDQQSDKTFCGMFKTPTLRNVATRGAFFHNGRFSTLKETLEFYVQRDTNPEKWYPKNKDGSINKFNDLPPALRANVDIVDEPLTRKKGDKPAWNTTEINEVIAFLKTLNDGYSVAKKR